MPPIPEPNRSPATRFPVGRLHEEIAKVCPIVGCCANDPANRATWQVWFDENNPPTDAQKAALANVIATFNTSTIPEQAEEHFRAAKEVTLHCLTAGVDVPQEWRDYAKQLIECIAGSTLVLPQRPQLPNGIAQVEQVRAWIREQNKKG